MIRRQESYSQRDTKEKTLLSLVGFKDGRGPEPRNMGGPWKLERQGNMFYSRASRRNTALPTLDFSPVKPILDF